MECKMILKSCAAKLAKETKVPAGENSELQSLSCSPKNFSAQPGLDWLCARAVDAKITWDGRRGQKDKVGLRKGLRGSMRDWVGGKSGKRQNCPRKRLDGSDAWLTWSQKVSDVAALHSVHSTSALLMNCSSSSPNCTMHIALNTLHVTLNTALHEIGLYTFTSHRTPVTGKWKTLSIGSLTLGRRQYSTKCNSGQCCYSKSSWQQHCCC